MPHENVHPVFKGILDSLEKPNPIDQIISQANVAKERVQILLEGYSDLMRLLESPSGIDKKTLMQSIGKTLKKASE